MGAATPEAWGVARGFWDNEGNWRTASEATLEAVMAAMRPEGELPHPSGTVVVTSGEMVAVDEPEVVLEGGDRRVLTGSLPADLPLGYHVLVGEGAARRLIVAPARCHLPPDLFGWGLAVQLYSVLSAGSQGIGDLADLRQLGGWARELGARFLLLNPLHAPLPGPPQEPSPYYPSSRRFRSPLYLRVPGLPPARPEGLIDRDAVWKAKLAALGAEWQRRRGTVTADVEAFMAGTPGLEDYARFVALSEQHGRPWHRWPEEYRNPRGPAVARFAAERRDRVLFRAWLQMEVDRQLEAAREPGTIADLAVGFHPDGADAWAFQDCLAPGISVGAPPDPFNAAGQDWGLPPFDPWRLAAAGFEPYVQTLRAAFRHAAGIRVDHVMGLFRLYWIPVGEGPGAGTYVAYPHGELLDILALESVRAGGYVVGEDLGTVQPEVREALRERDVLSYRLLWFEPGPPGEYPTEALAALTTHDLPTLMGVWTESDPMPEVRSRLIRDCGLDDGDGGDQVLDAAYRLLAGAPTRLLAATLEDVALSADRPNLPGRVEASNWSRPLALTLEELTTSPRARHLAAILGAGRSPARRLD